MACFCYEIYTLVGDRCLFVLEQALRDRFIEYHQGNVTFVDPADGSRKVIAAANYTQLYDALRGSRRRGRPAWQLLLGSGEQIPFNGGLSGLRVWARRTGLLRGQRNRVVEQAISDLRNMAAHPNGYHLSTPVDAARTLGNLSEIINQLWGASTPGGRLYPAPLARAVVILAWDPSGTRFTIGLAEAAHSWSSEEQQWRCIVLRAVFSPGEHESDPSLHEFDSRHEVTTYPTDLLWGPGSVGEAVAWYAEHHPKPDQCEYLDRIFVVRHHAGQLFRPMRATVASALPDEELSGRWHAVKADHPNSAYQHVRGHVSANGCSRHGPCARCQAETVKVGDYLAVLPFALGSAAPMLPADVTMPAALPRSLPIA